MNDEARAQRASDHARTPLVQAPAADPEQEESHEPKSTFVLMLIFLMLLAGIWFYVYQILLSRR